VVDGGDETGASTLRADHRRQGHRTRTESPLFSRISIRGGNVSSRLTHGPPLHRMNIRLPRCSGVFPWPCPYHSSECLALKSPGNHGGEKVMVNSCPMWTPCPEWTGVPPFAGTARHGGHHHCRSCKNLDVCQIGSRFLPSARHGRLHGVKSQARLAAGSSQRSRSAASEHQDPEHRCSILVERLARRRRVTVPACAASSQRER
jgi:hypothetical protein